MRLFRIVARHFVAGLESGGENDNDIVRTAPIIKYMVGWRVSRAFLYCGQKGWEMEEVEPHKEKENG